MTWNPRDAGHQTPAKTPREKVGRAPTDKHFPTGAENTVYDLDDPENLPSVFEAMGIGTEAGSIFQRPASFPRELERELERDFGWPSERTWDTWRKLVTRDTKAV